MNSIISVENLSKKYIIGYQKQDKYNTFRDALMHNVRSVYQKIRHPLSFNKEKIEVEDFWALKNVSFEVNQGDRLGIIGHNGAGKSTLLKILSRITAPTTGRATINGRVSSLLEVGTGFHPELSGRENIFLNGAVLGMNRHEIRKKFDQIIDFAEVEKFIDTPIKRYSSGMFVRLAFSVAAHLDPDILIVDEVLSVGDVQFQRKCLGKMGDIAKEGRTILFVSHNMNAVEQLCTSAILLEAGEIKKLGNEVVSIIKDYVFVPDGTSYPNEWISNDENTYKNDYFRPLEFYLSDTEGKKLNMPVRNDAEMWVTIVGEVKKLDTALLIGYELYAEDGTLLYGSAFTDSHPDNWPEIKKGKTTLRSKIPKHFLNEGLYKLELNGGLMHKEWFFLPGMKNPAIFLEIKGGLSQSPYWVDKRLGLIAPILDWE